MTDENWRAFSIGLVLSSIFDSIRHRNGYLAAFQVVILASLVGPLLWSWKWKEVA